jgi:hypothetical protein
MGLLATLFRRQTSVYEPREGLISRAPNRRFRIHTWNIHVGRVDVLSRWQIVTILAVVVEAL